MLPEAVIEADLNINLTYVNQRALEMSGYSQEDFKNGLNALDIITPESRSKAKEYLKKRLAGDDPGAVEYNAQKKDGTIYPILVNAKTLFLNDQLQGVIAVIVDITKLKQAEKDLKESEEKHKIIIETAISGFWITNNKGYLLEVNDSYCRISGYSKDELLTMKVSDIEVIDSQEDIKNRINYLIQNGSDRFETKHRKKDGSVYDVAINIQYNKVFNNDQFIVFIDDITERKQAEELLKKSETSLRDAQRIANIGNCSLDLQTGKVEMSDEMFNLIGIKDKNETLDVSNHEKFYTSESWQIFNKALENIINTGKSYEIEMEFSKKNAKFRYAIARGEAVYDDNNKIIGLKGTLQNITERKQAQKSIIALEKRNQALLDHSPVCHKIVDLDFNLQYMSANGFKMLKLDQNFKVYGKPYPFEFFSDLFRNKMIETIQKVKETGNTLTLEGMTNDVEGNEVWLDSTIVPVLDNDKIAYLTVVSADTTQRKREEINRKRLEQNLIQSQKSEAIGSLAGGIAHDFNNLLFPIIGLSELLLEDLEETSREYENILEIFKAGMRGSELVKQILTFSRQSEQKMIPTRIQKIIKEVLKLSRSTIPSYIEIIQDIQSDCELAMADSIKIHQVAMNIITNAYHAVEEAKTDKISVHLRQVYLEKFDLPGLKLEPGKYAILSVSDTGNGISKKIINKIFDPYFTTKEQGKGTGLGLAVVYGIIQEHKGDIKVYTEIGQGTTFNVYLPLMDKTTQLDTKELIENLQTGDERVLLVDDELSIVKLEKFILERLGYKITMFTNSIEALEVFKENPDSFDIIITDMNMPNMAGDELASEIKSIRSDIPIILCTGFSERLNKEKNEILGISEILMKPVIRSEVAKTVRKLLDKL